MAGLAVGYWKGPAECFAAQKIDKVFKPKMSAEERDRLYAEWTKAVKRSMAWVSG